MRFYCAGALLLLAFAFQVRMILLFSRMMDEVNGVLPADSRIPEIGPSWLQGRVIKAHRRFFPESRLRKKMYTAWVVEVTAFTAAVA